MNYYIDFRDVDDLSSVPGWRLFSRRHIGKQGECIPLAVFCNVYIARLIRNSLNSTDDVP